MKALFVGLGSIGQRHLRNLVEIMGQEVEIYAYRVKRAGFILNNKLEIIDHDNLESRFHIHVVKNLDEAWQTGMDCVFICNPTSFHMDIMLEAAEHNCHIFVEKPLSHSLENLERLERLIAEKNLITFIGYQNRFHPCIKKTKSLLLEGVIGRIIMVSAEIGENVKQWHKYEDYRTMYACRKDLGGGVVLSQIHELDYLLSFLGMPKSVYAVGGKNSDLEIDVEDSADILLRYCIEGNNIPVNIREDYLQNPPVRACKIVGTKGKIEFDLLESHIIVYDNEGRIYFEKTYEFERNDMFVEELKIFLNAVKKEKYTGELIPVSEGVKSLKVALAVKRSMDSGEIIEL